MPLRFSCVNCNKPIIVAHLKIGEQAKCPHCGALMEVPANSIEIDKQNIEFPADNADSRAAQFEKTTLDELADSPIIKGPQSIAVRAFLAVILMIGFYVLALGIALFLLIVVYIDVTSSSSISVRLLFFCLAGAGIIIWSIFPRPNKFADPGPRLDKTVNPQIFEVIENIAKSMDQKMPSEIYLVPNINAWVSQRGGFMGMGSSRVMGIGLPLLETTTVSQLRGIIAHEFGHYYSGDTKLGPWIYKTRGALGRTITSLQKNRSILQLPFVAYGKMFLRITQAISRRQEFMADILSARLVGPRALMESLKSLGANSVAFDSYWHEEIAPVLNAGYHPPIMNGFNRFLSSSFIAPKLTEFQENEMKHSITDPYDSHPSLRARLASLQKIENTGNIESDNRKASCLLINPTNFEKDLLLSLYKKEFVDKLKPVNWGEVINLVYYPAWKNLVEKHGSGLKGTTLSSVTSSLIKSSEFKKKNVYPKTIGDNAEAQEIYLCSLMGGSLSLALYKLGWETELTPGEPLSFRNNGNTICPFEIFPNITNGIISEADWQARCAALGISDIDLGHAGGTAKI
jgi:heat shock protein HtpX